MRDRINKVVRALLSGLVGGVIILVVLSILYPNILSRDQAREELLAFRNQLSVGMGEAKVEAAFEEGGYKLLTLRKLDAVWIVQTPYLTGAVNWELRLTLENGTLAGLSIRTADSKDHLPKGAPRDIGPSGEASHLKVQRWPS